MDVVLMSGTFTPLPGLPNVTTLAWCVPPEWWPLVFSVGVIIGLLLAAIVPSAWWGRSP